jgi:hypothetical protein
MYFCNNLIDILINTNLIEYFGLNIYNFININSYFLSACQNNNINIIKYLLENYKIDINYKDKLGNNCLFYASCSNDINTIKYLQRKYKFDINMENYSKKNCLMFACTFINDIHLIEKLVESIDSFDENIPRHPDKNYLNNLDIIKYLIED